MLSKTAQARLLREARFSEARFERAFCDSLDKLKLFHAHVAMEEKGWPDHYIEGGCWVELKSAQRNFGSRPQCFKGLLSPMQHIWMRTPSRDAKLVGILLQHLDQEAYFWLGTYRAFVHMAWTRDDLSVGAWDVGKDGWDFSPYVAHELRNWIGGVHAPARSCPPAADPPQHAAV